MALHLPISCLFLICALCSSAEAQDGHAQYPRVLANSYIGLNIGYIGYPFSNTQMESGFRTESIRVPHLGVRALLLGHEFNKYLSAQITYMRPVQWVEYENVNGDRSSHSVWMNVAGLTAKPQLPLTKTVSVYGEAGLGIITRKGFEIRGASAIKDANYATILFGTGFQYQVTDRWSLDIGFASSPANSDSRQPRTTFFSGGFHFTMRPLSTEQVERNSNSGIVFPRNIVQAGYSTNALGYGANDFVSRGAVPVFWAAEVRVAHGYTLNYEHNVFHTRRLFSLDWGTGIASWESGKNGEKFKTASLFPVLGFTAIRKKPVDFYFKYSLAGPTFVSRTAIDGFETGRRFTFQDFMGIGVFTGARKRLNAELRIAHFSNGNLFPRNAGVTVPLGLNLGYAF